MAKAKLLPFINKFTGDVKTLTKSQGKHLSEDWARAKVVTNDKGKKVFRFELSRWVKGRDGKMHKGTAVVDLSEVENPDEEAKDGNGSTK